MYFRYLIIISREKRYGPSFEKNHLESPSRKEDNTNLSWIGPLVLEKKMQ